MSSGEQSESSRLARLVNRAEQYSPLAMFLMVAGAVAVILLIPGLLGGILTLGLAVGAAALAYFTRGAAHAPGTNLMRYLAVAALIAIAIVKLWE